MENVMNGELIHPHRLQVLGKLMRPILMSLQTGMNKTVGKVLYVADMVPIVQCHTGEIVNAVHNLENSVNDLMGDVVSNETVDDAGVYLAVAPIKATLNKLMANYHSVLALNVVTSKDIEARDLLVGTYRYWLNQVRSWLVDVVEALEDPVAFLKKRRMPTSGMVELPLILKLGPAPQTQNLANWMKHHARASPYTIPKKEGMGFLDTVFAVVVGFCIGDFLFGGDD
jgi:hypothetical protein